MPMETEGKDVALGLGPLSRMAAEMGAGRGRAYNARIREDVGGPAGLMALVSSLAAAVEEQEQEVKILAEKLAPMLSAQVPEKPTTSRAIPTTTSAAGQHLTAIYNQITNNTDNLRTIRSAIEV